MLESKVYEFNLNVQSTGMPAGEITSGAIDTIASGSAKEQASISASEALLQGAQKRVVNTTISQTIISPLNSATGGLAQPLYTIGRAAAAGKWAAVGGGAVALGIAVIQLGLQKMQQRVEKLENEAARLNEQDNAMIRAGAFSGPTFYSRRGLSGVDSTTNRRAA